MDLKQTLLARWRDGLMGLRNALTPLVEADAQALADVRTLDDWQWATYGREIWTDRYAGDPELEATVTLSDEFGAEQEFTGLTLTEARAAAAAWVRSEREQARKVQG